jgi:hypothetical protein
VVISVGEALTIPDVEDDSAADQQCDDLHRIANGLEFGSHCGTEPQVTYDDG